MVLSLSTLVGLAFVLSVRSVFAASKSADASGKFLLFSDTHYDRYYGTEYAFQHESYDSSAVEFPCRNSNASKFGSYGCGSSKDLIRSAVASAAQALPNPDFVLFTGDATRHGTAQVPNVSDTVQLSMSLIPQLMNEYFSNTQVVYLPPIDLGNNDFKGDYSLNITSTKPCYIETLENGTVIYPKPTNDWLKTVAARFNSSFASEKELATFRCGGYMVRHVTPQLSIIVLNTVLWSRYLNTDAYAQDLASDVFDPFGQHAWLNTTLADLKQSGRRVYISGHIPPMLQSFQFALGQSLVYPQHAERYYDTIARYQDSVVAGQFFGHVHTNELRHLPQMDNHYPPMVVSGSISPCYRSTPFYSVVTYDKNTSYPTDLVTYNTDLDAASDNDTMLSFQPMFDSLVVYLGMDNLTNGEVARLSSRLAVAAASEEGSTSKGNLWQKYWNTWRQGMPQPECNSQCQLQEACIIKCGTHTLLYEGCISNNNPECVLSDEAYASTMASPSQLSFAWIGIAVVAVVFVIFVSFKAVRTCRRRRSGRVPLPDIDETVMEASIPNTEMNGGRPIPAVA